LPDQGLVSNLGRESGPSLNDNEAGARSIKRRLRWPSFATGLFRSSSFLGSSRTGFVRSIADPGARAEDSRWALGPLSANRLVGLFFSPVTFYPPPPLTPAGPTPLFPFPPLSRFLRGPVWGSAASICWHQGRRLCRLCDRARPPDPRVVVRFPPLQRARLRSRASKLGELAFRRNGLCFGEEGPPGDEDRGRLPQRAVRRDRNRQASLSRPFGFLDRDPGEQAAGPCRADRKGVMGPGTPSPGAPSEKGKKQPIGPIPDAPISCLDPGGGPARNQPRSARGSNLGLRGWSVRRHGPHRCRPIIQCDPSEKMTFKMGMREIAAARWRSGCR